MSIKIRRKKIKKGESLYLDYYYKGVRQYEFLSIHLTGDKVEDRKKLKIAEQIKAKKEIELNEKKILIKKLLLTLLDIHFKCLQLNELIHTKIKENNDELSST